MLVLLLALFGFAVELLDAEPRSGSVIRLALFEQPRVPGQLVLGTWLVESSGLIALFLLTQGRFATWWLDGLVAGWVAWIFRGPLLVITIVVAARQPQDPWWTLAFGWWVLYSVCGLCLAILARRSGLEPWLRPQGASASPLGSPAGSADLPSAPEEAAREAGTAEAEEPAVESEPAVEPEPVSEGTAEGQPSKVDDEAEARSASGPLETADRAEPEVEAVTARREAEAE